MADEKLLISAEVQNKFYTDALSKPATATGTLSEDLIKSFHLFLVPFQLMALAQDRLRGWLDRIRSEVPIERQTDAAPEIAGPVLEKLRFIDDSNPLKDLYLNLLEAAIDTERKNLAHPAFVDVINRLSPADALMLWQIWQLHVWGLGSCIGVRSIALSWKPFSGTRLRVVSSSQGTDKTTQLAGRMILSNADYDSAQMSIEILQNCGVVKNVEHEKTANSTRRSEGTRLKISDFGAMFAKVCLPEEFECSKPNEVLLHWEPNPTED